MADSTLPKRRPNDETVMPGSTLPKRRPNDGTVMPGSTLPKRRPNGTADSTLPKRRPNGTVMPGSTLNPTGRPRIVQEIQELARSAAPAAFERVVALMSSDDERIALAASQEILNRAYGKPVMSVQSDVRRVDMSAVWARSMEALNKQLAEPPTIDVTATEAAPELKKLVEPPMIEGPALELPPDDDLALLSVQIEPPLDDDQAEAW
jgi:hypothetical protein